MISYNKDEDPSKTLDQLCFILKARMTNEAAVERYEHRNTCMMRCGPTSVMMFGTIRLIIKIGIREVTSEEMFL